MSCITDEAFAAWLSGALAAEEQAAAIAHAATCAACRAVLGDLFGPLTGTAAPIMVGRYRIQGAIAAGGMGVVLRAIDPALDRPLAIKMAQATQVDAGHRARMLREAQAMARLAHPNVVAVHDYGEIDGEVFVAMALVDGVMLHRWLADGPRPAAARARVLAEIGSGLVAIHAAGFIHRDIKPENVIVRDDGHAVIVDFGLARGSREVVIGAGSGIAGTPSYLAPEILGGAAASAASDQFAWWRVVDEVMAGVALAPAARRRLAAAIARGTAPAPADRWPDMTAAVAALDGALRRPRARWPIVVGAVVAVAAAAVIVALLVTRGGAPEPCAATAPEGWDAATRERFRPNLVAAGADADRVFAAIDARAKATAALGVEACRAARTRDPAERARALRRQVCLEESWNMARAQMAGLASADRESVRNALDVLIQVVPAERCAATRLPSVASPPAPDRAEAVAAAERVLAELKRDNRTAPAERLAALDLATSALAATAYPPLLARMHWHRANLLTDLGRHAEAGAALDEGLARAIAAADDELTARIAIERLRLAYMAGEREVPTAETAARTAVDHLDNPALSAELDVAIATQRMAIARDAEAVELLQRALTTYDRIAIADHEQPITALQLLSSELQATGDLPGAQAVLDRAVEIGRKRYGEDAVTFWYVVSNRAANRAYLGDVQASADELAIAVEHLRGADPADPRVAHVSTQHCATQLELTRAASVPACRDAVTATASAFGTDHPQLIWPLVLLGQGQLQADDLDGAATTLDRAVTIGERAAIGPNDLLFARAHLAIAVRKRDPRRARRLLDAVVPVLLATPNTEPTRFALAKAFPALAKQLGVGSNR